MPRHALFSVGLSRGTGDCAITCLAAITGADYATVVAAVARKYQRWRSGQGLTVPKIRAVALELGCRLRWRRAGRFNLHQTAGIIVVRPHVAILKPRGKVHETDGTLSKHDVTQWLARHAPTGDYGALIPGEDYTSP